MLADLRFNLNHLSLIDSSILKLAPLSLFLNSRRIDLSATIASSHKTMNQDVEPFTTTNAPTILKLDKDSLRSLSLLSASNDFRIAPSSLYLAPLVATYLNQNFKLSSAKINRNQTTGCAGLFALVPRPILQ